MIFSRSAKGLQNIVVISKMESFCDFADLDVNIDKTKVNNYSFRLENVKSNKYLGLSPYGRNFNLARSRRKNCTQSLYPQYFYTEAKCGVLIVTEKYKRPGSRRIGAEKIIKMTTFLSKNDACKGEMESFPMIIDAHTYIHTYILYLSCRSVKIGS